MTAMAKTTVAGIRGDTHSGRGDDPRPCTTRFARERSFYARTRPQAGKSSHCSKDRRAPESKTPGGREGCGCDTARVLGRGYRNYHRRRGSPLFVGRRDQGRDTVPHPGTHWRAGLHCGPGRLSAITSASRPTSRRVSASCAPPSTMGSTLWTTAGTITTARAKAGWAKRCGTATVSRCS
jgi:hypothetical protein